MRGVKGKVACRDWDVGLKKGRRGERGGVVDRRGVKPCGDRT